MARNQNWPVALTRYGCTVKGSVAQMQEFKRHVLGRRGEMHPFVAARSWFAMERVS